LGIVLFPMKVTSDWRSIFDVKKRVDLQDIQEIRNRVETTLRLPLFVLGDTCEMEKLANLIVDYFSNEGEVNER